MQKIYKYPIQTTDEQTITVPIVSEILTVQVINGQPYIYAMVDSDITATRSIEIRIYGTGHEITDENLNYIGTYQIIELAFIGHVFELQD